MPTQILGHSPGLVALDLPGAVAERVCATIEPEAWVLDDTGVPKDGKHSPGVKRQYLSLIHISEPTRPY